jgi:hypothetical protein
MAHLVRILPRNRQKQSAERQWVTAGDEGNFQIDCDWLLCSTEILYRGDDLILIEIG